MSVGGATWDTAGILTLGSANTFDPADVTEVTGLSPYFNHAWWTFTPTVSRQYVLSAELSSPTGDDMRLGVYLGATEDEAHLAGFSFGGEFNGVAGTTYHILAATHDEDGNGVTEYRVTLTAGDPVIATGWLELTDNVNNAGLENNLIVSRDGYDLQATNVRSDYQIWQTWMGDVIRRLGRPGRDGIWAATEVFFSPHPPSEAVECIWSHANWGEDGSQLWTDAAQEPSPPGEPVCLPLGDIPNDLQTNLGIGYKLTDGEPPIGFAARRAEAESAMSARAVYFAPVRDSTQETGALFFPDPVADGVPENADLEWESDHVTLLGVDIAGDNVGRPDESAYPIDIAIHDNIQPSYDPVAEDYGNWLIGYPGGWNGEGAGYQLIPYAGGPTIDWEELDVAVTGDDGWESAADPDTGDPDTVAIIGMDVGWGPTPALADVASTADMALRFRLQSPRYRWVYPATAPGVIPPRRIDKRSDGATHGARRVGAGNTRQSGSRTLGAIL